MVQRQHSEGKRRQYTYSQKHRLISKFPTFESAQGAIQKKQFSQRFWYEIHKQRETIGRLVDDGHGSKFRIMQGRDGGIETITKMVSWCVQIGSQTCGSSADFGLDFGELEISGSFPTSHINFIYCVLHGMHCN